MAFGDFQTPDEFARECCAILAARGLVPASILEPTCGRGSFLNAAIHAFPNAAKVIGFDINPEHLEIARERMARFVYKREIAINQGDFFDIDWKAIIHKLPEPLLIVGNPPWVTNSDLGSLGSANLPKKSNFQNHKGIDAITGKSNFDISEWMLLRSFEWSNGRDASVAVLCKTAVARKVLSHAWNRGFAIAQADVYRFDAQKHFGAAVDACFLVVVFAPGQQNQDCFVHNSLREETISGIFGFRDDQLIADITKYNAWKHLKGDASFVWRSGIKHDCAAVFELYRENNSFRNGLGELAELEWGYLFPMLKSSEVASDGEIHPKRWMLVPQKSISEGTQTIKHIAPMTWQYLIQHASLLDRRASSIYKGRPRFSIFGVGDYSFSPWKVGVSGFYKKLKFRVIGPFQDKPVVLDDTCYFLACENKSEAVAIAELLNSEVAKDFFSAFLFWDTKRPITLELLRQLDLIQLARQSGVGNQVMQILQRMRAPQTHANQQMLFRESEH